MAYSAQEIRAFRLKDLMYARQSALKAASINNEGKGKKPASIKKEADEYFDWLQQGQDTVPEPAKESDVPVNKPKKEDDYQEPDVLPTATLAQKKVMDAIFEELKVTSQKAKQVTIKNVLRWVYETYDGAQQLPSKPESVQQFLRWAKQS